MDIGSLFSGIGGIELGFKREGFETKWFIEADEYCQRVLEKNFLGIPIYKDIRTVNFIELERVDILTGGFPCQDISTANPKGEGISGSRSGLWSYYAEAIRILRPSYAVIENVPNLANRGFNVVLRDLAEIGYDAEWNVISARGVGARHLRRRLFIVAYPKCEPRYVRADEKCGERRDEPTQLDFAASNYGLPDTDHPRNRTSRSGINGHEQEKDKRWQELTQLKSCRYGTDISNTDKLNGNDGGLRAGTLLGERSEKTELRGSEEDVADPNTEGLQGHGRSLESPGEFFTATMRIQLAEFRRRNQEGIWRADPADLPDTNSTRWQERERECGTPIQRVDPKDRASGPEWWSTESRVGRVAHGVSKRVDRLKCLGNAVVPQVAQFIARRIKEIEGL